MTHGDQTGPIQGPAQMSIARFADVRFQPLKCESGHRLGVI